MTSQVGLVAPNRTVLVTGRLAPPAVEAPAGVEEAGAQNVILRLTLLVSVVASFLAGSSAPTPALRHLPAGLGVLADHHDGRVRGVCPRGADRTHLSGPALESCGNVGR